MARIRVDVVMGEQHWQAQPSYNKYTSMGGLSILRICPQSNESYIRIPAWSLEVSEGGPPLKTLVKDTSFRECICNGWDLHGGPPSPGKRLSDR